MTGIAYFSPILIVNASACTPQHKNILHILQCNLRCLYFTTIIMELRPPSTTETYTNFQDLHVAVNIHASKEGYAITTKQSKKNKKGELRKVWMQCDKGGVFKAMSLMRHPKLELKIAELLEVGGLTGLVGLVGVGGLEGANRGGRLSRTAGGGRVGRTGRVGRARGKKTDLLLLTELEPKKLE